MKVVQLLTALFAYVWASNEIDLRYAVMGFKGFMSGFQKGLYDDEFFSVETSCLGTEEINEKLLFMYEFLNGREAPIKVLQFTTTTKEVFMDQMEQCGYTKSVRDLQEWCHAHGLVDVEERCTNRTLIRNFYQRFFNMIGHYQRVTERITYFGTTDTHEVYLDCLFIGREIGETIKVLYEFDP